MNRPPLEVADILREVGRDFIEKSRRWLTWQHVRVLRAKLRGGRWASGDRRWRTGRDGSWQELPIRRQTVGAEGYRAGTA